jgi:hypothetical protein
MLMRILHLRAKAIHLQIAPLRWHSILCDKPSFAFNYGTDRSRVDPVGRQETWYSPAIGAASHRIRLAAGKDIRAAGSTAMRSFKAFH